MAIANTRPYMLKVCAYNSDFIPKDICSFGRLITQRKHNNAKWVYISAAWRQYSFQCTKQKWLKTLRLHRLHNNIHVSSKCHRLFTNIYDALSLSNYEFCLGKIGNCSVEVEIFPWVRFYCYQKKSIHFFVVSISSFYHIKMLKFSKGSGAWVSKIFPC